MQPRTHGAEPHLGDFGDLFVGHLVQKAQRQHLAVRSGEALEAGVTVDGWPVSRP